MDFHIEGNHLTLRETVAILHAGADVTLRRKGEADEVIGMKNAIDRIQELVLSKAEWRAQKEFLSVHAILMAAKPDIAGRLRSERVMLTGAKHQPPGDLQIPELLTNLFSQLGESEGVDAVEVATWTHWSIARIHPFMDGNGRMARLWQDLVLFRGKLTSAIIRPEDRTEYYRALTAADDGEFNPLAQLIAQRFVAQQFLKEVLLSRLV